MKINLKRFNAWRIISGFITTKVNKPIKVGGTESGQSIIASGLVINEDAGNTSQDNFRIETGNKSDSFEVDAENDSINMNVSINKSIRTVSSDYTITNFDNTILIYGAINQVTITLPSAIGITGRVYNIKSLDDTFTTDIETFGTEEIDEDSSAFVLSKHETITIQSDGSNWWII